MKISDFLKNTLSVLLVFSILLTLFGCVPNNIDSSVTESTVDSDTKILKGTYIIDKTTIGDNIMDYKITKVGDSYYIVFDDISLYVTNYNNSEEFINPVTSIHFDSMTEMQDAILNGKLLTYQKDILTNQFYKDDNGILITDPYNIYTIKHPTIYYKENPDVGVNYSGYYWVSVYDKDGSANNDWWEYQIPTEQYYEYQLKEKFQLSKGDTLPELVEEHQLSDGRIIKRSATVSKIEDYPAIDITSITYVLSDSNKTMFVEKTYFDSDFCGIFLLAVVNDSQYFTVSLYPKTYSDEDLTDEFLFGFDVEAIERT